MSQVGNLWGDERGLVELDDSSEQRINAVVVLAELLRRVLYTVSR